MREEHWYRMLVISLALHVVIVGAFSIPLKKGSKKISLPSYSVNLVGEIGGAAGRGPAPAPVVRQAEKPIPEKPKREIAKKRPPVIKEREPVRTLAPKKQPVRETPTREEVKSVADKIREMKKRTGEANNGNGGDSRPYGLSGTQGGGGGRFLDPVLLKYLKSVQERMQAAWRIPMTISKKADLETVVTIRVRRDGRISDMAVDKRSGNRTYDESVLRILRTIELPPLPQSVEDPFEIELHCRPEGVV